MRVTDTGVHVTRRSGEYHIMRQHLRGKDFDYTMAMCARFTEMALQHAVRCAQADKVPVPRTIQQMCDVAVQVGYQQAFVRHNLRMRNAAILAYTAPLEPTLTAINSLVAQHLILTTQKDK